MLYDEVNNFSNAESWLSNSDICSFFGISDMGAEFLNSFVGEQFFVT